MEGKNTEQRNGVEQELMYRVWIKSSVASFSKVHLLRCINQDLCSARFAPK